MEEYCTTLLCASDCFLYSVLSTFIQSNAAVIPSATSATTTTTTLSSLADLLFPPRPSPFLALSVLGSEGKPGGC